MLTMCIFRRGRNPLKTSIQLQLGGPGRIILPANEKHVYILMVTTVGCSESVWDGKEIMSNFDVIIKPI